MKKTLPTVAVAAVLALGLAACGERDEQSASEGGGAPEATSQPTEEAPTTEAPTASPEPAAEQFPDFKACMVSDSGGFDDQSFNETSKAGLDAAVAAYGMQEGTAESSDPSEFVDNINNLVRQDCNSITTVGFLLGEATEGAARRNPDIDFSIVDFAYEQPSQNLKGLVFNAAEPAYLAGYLAAAVTETGFVGTFGGQQIPSVTDFMTGYSQGVDRWNEENPDSPVQVLGWDPATEEGSFTNDFENRNLGQTTAEELITQGADIIMPVAGPAGLGGLQAARDAGNVQGIWVDTDGCVSTEFCDVLLTSVTKGLDVAVEAAITDSANGEFNNELFVGTLANDGVGLGQFSDSVDAELQAKLDELRQEIIDGDVTVG